MADQKKSLSDAEILKMAREIYAQDDSDDDRLIVGDKEYRSSDILREIEARTPFGQEMLEAIRHSHELDEKEKEEMTETKPLSDAEVIEKLKTVFKDYDPDEKLPIMFGNKQYSPNELILEIETGTDDGKQFLQAAKKMFEKKLM